jgi:ribonuclease HII
MNERRVMSANEMFPRLQPQPSESSPNWRRIRDRITEGYSRVSTADRVKLLQLYQAVIEMAERQIPPNELEQFRVGRMQDYYRMLVSEWLSRDGKVSPATMDAVTRREVAAGRMAADDALRRIAAAGVVAKTTRRLGRLRRFGRHP